MYVDAYVTKHVRLMYLTGSTINDIYKALSKFTDFESQTKLYEIEQLITTLKISDREMQLRNEIVFCQEQIKTRIDYLTLSCIVAESQRKQLDLQEKIQEANRNMANIKLVPTT